MEIRDCEGYPGFRVSDTGEVFKGDEPVKLYSRPDKYISVHLRNEKGYSKPALVHRLMVQAFRGIPKGFVIDHINGIKNDNRLENLEAVTIKENNIRRYKLQGPPMRLSEYICNKSLQLISK